MDKVGKRVLVGALVLLVSVAVGVMLRPMLGIVFFFVGFGAYLVLLSVLKDCDGCGPVFPRKCKPEEEVDEAEDMVRLVTVYECPRCWHPIGSRIETISLREHREREINKLTAMS